jgi:hypothetical protein
MHIVHVCYVIVWRWRNASSLLPGESSFHCSTPLSELTDKDGNPCCSMVNEADTDAYNAAAVRVEMPGPMAAEMDVPWYTSPCSNTNPAARPPRKLFPAPLSCQGRDGSAVDTLTGDVYDVGGVLRCPKGIDPSASLFAGCDTRSKNITSYDHTAISGWADTEIKEATCRSLNGVARDRRGQGEESKGLLCVWAMEMSYGGRRDGQCVYLRTSMEAMAATREGNSSGTQPYWMERVTRG